MDLYFPRTANAVKTLCESDWVKINVILNNCINDEIDINLGTLLSMHLIACFLKEGSFPIFFTDKQKEACAVYNSKLAKIISSRIGRSDDSAMLTSFGTIIAGNLHVFWKFFDHCNCYKRISPETFTQMMSRGLYFASPSSSAIITNPIKHQDNICAILRQKKIVKQYPDIIKEHLLTCEQAAEVVVAAYCASAKKSERMHFPPDLDISEILIFFTSSCSERFDLLQSLAGCKCSSSFNISTPAEIRARARCRYDTLCNKLSRTDVVNSEWSVTWHSEDSPTIYFTQEANTQRYAYPLKYLAADVSPLRILYNLTYVFRLIDQRMLISQACDRYRLEQIESIVLNRAENHYTTSREFAINKSLTNGKLWLYALLLEKHGTCLEEALAFFYREHINSRYAVPPFRAYFPTNNSDLVVKCTMLATAIESIVRQYSHFVEKGTLDFNALILQQDTVDFTAVPSLIPSKYAYFTSKDLHYAADCFANRFNKYSYVPRLCDKWPTFYHYVVNERIYLSDYHELDHEFLRKMESLELLLIAQDGEISLGNQYKVAALIEGNANKAINVHRMPAEIQSEISAWEVDGQLVYESTLLTRDEGAFFNYHMNNIGFANSLSLRNKCCHGGIPFIDDTNKLNEMYLDILRIAILLTLKINDDLQQRDSIQRHLTPISSSDFWNTQHKLKLF